MGLYVVIAIEWVVCLGGAGLTLTAARIEPGTVRLTLSPVDRAGSAERVHRVAAEWNARGGPA